MENGDFDKKYDHKRNTYEVSQERPPSTHTKAPTGLCWFQNI